MRRQRSRSPPGAGLVSACRWPAGRALIYFFLFSPIVLLILLSFNKNRYGSFPITGWTLHWFTSIASSPDLQEAIKTSLRVGLEVTLVSHGRRDGGRVSTCSEPPRRFRTAFRIAFTLPIMIPGVLIGVSLLTFLRQGLGIPAVD